MTDAMGIHNVPWKDEHNKDSKDTNIPGMEINFGSSPYSTHQYGSFPLYMLEEMPDNDETEVDTISQELDKLVAKRAEMAMARAKRSALNKERIRFKASLSYKQPPSWSVFPPQEFVFTMMARRIQKRFKSY